MNDKEYMDLLNSNIKEIVSKELNLKSEQLELLNTWNVKCIQNRKSLVVIKNLDTGLLLPYFIECSLHGDKNELYLDFYTKDFKRTIHY